MEQYYRLRLIKFKSHEQYVHLHFFIRYAFCTFHRLVAIMGPQLFPPQVPKRDDDPHKLQRGCFCAGSETVLKWADSWADDALVPTFSRVFIPLPVGFSASMTSAELLPTVNVTTIISLFVHMCAPFPVSVPTLPPVFATPRRRKYGSTCQIVQETPTRPINRTTVILYGVGAIVVRRELDLKSNPRLKPIVQDRWA